VNFSERFHYQPIPSLQASLSSLKDPFTEQVWVEKRHNRLHHLVGDRNQNR
jgi:hypothetical protein